MRIGIKSGLLGSYIIILILFIGTIVFSLRSIKALKENVQLTHDHPLTVTRAVINIEVEIISIHRSMKDVVLSFSDEDRNQYISKVQISENKAFGQFDIVQKQILGKKGEKLALIARNVFKDWKPIRDEVISMMEDGEYEKATYITQNEGDEYVETIREELELLEEYAANKALEFNEESDIIASTTRNFTITALSLSILISIFIAVFFTYSIIKRLRVIREAATKMASGELNLQINSDGRDEIKKLADSFNKMSYKLKTQYDSLEVKVEKRTKELKEANEELQKLKEYLEETIIARTKELEDKVIELNRGERAMLYMVEDLNLTSGQLKEEKENLSIANKELDAFAYSVSHDLRAPLRHINGFTKLLRNKVANNIDEKSNAYFDNIVSSSEQMNVLIDDLLLFSRMGREEVKKRNVNMKTIINEAIQILSLDIENKNISIVVDDMPNAYVDTSLLAQVWTNLISNAIKFSSKAKTPKIHIGVNNDDENTIYFIADNGVGFNQKYAEKMFGVFQRLHSVNEFPGTGIGLANIKRIIMKHGGKVWAEGALNKGATLYFSLPNDKKLIP